MANKVNEYIKFLDTDAKEKGMTIEEINFRKYMLDKMEELGAYANMNVENFKDDFYVSQVSLHSEFGRGGITLCCYNKVEDSKNGDRFNLIYFMAHPHDDILLRKASTCWINLSNRMFEYYYFDKPDHLRWEVNIVNQIMRGVLPYHLFDPKVGDNITKGVIEKDFSEEALAHNCVYEIHDTIEKSNNWKLYWYQKPVMMWEVNPLWNYENNLKHRWPIIQSDIKAMSEGEYAKYKESLIEKASEIEDMDHLFKTMDLVRYKAEYDKVYETKPKKILVNILGNKN